MKPAGWRGFLLLAAARSVRAKECTWDNGCCKRHWRSTACMMGGALSISGGGGGARNSSKRRAHRHEEIGHFWGVSRLWSVFTSIDDVENYTVVDVGAGDGSTGIIAALKYGLGSVRAYDVQLVENSWMNVTLFDGAHIPEPDASADVVMFGYVLHHAAAKTPILLRDAARVSRRWVLVSEDLDMPEWRGRNSYHDAHAVFRSEQGWREQFAIAGLRVVASGPMFDMNHPCHYFILTHVNGPRLRTPSNSRAQVAAFAKLMQLGLKRGLRNGQMSIDR